MIAALMFKLIVRGKVKKTATVSINTTIFEEKGRSKMNRTKALLLISLAPYR